jgi:hypothetical protein
MEPHQRLPVGLKLMEKKTDRARNRPKPSRALAASGTNISQKSPECSSASPVGLDRLQRWTGTDQNGDPICAWIPEWISADLFDEAVSEFSNHRPIQARRPKPKGAN